MAKTLETSVEISGVLSPSLQAAINNAVSKLDEMSKETLEAAGAAEKLAAEITTQESVLKNLERGYADFVVSGGEGSEEAQQLAQHIQKLSNELDENRDTLENAQRAAEKPADSMEDTGSEADRLRKTINQQENTLQQLKERYAALALSEDDTSDESKELAQQIKKLSSELKDNKQRLSDAEYAANKLDNSLDKVEGSAQLAEKGFTVFKATLANLASSAIRSALSGIKQLASNVLELGQNFTHTMSEVQAISGATGDDFETLKATAREYGATTVFSASQSAEALKYMALAGWDVEQSTSALGGVLNLAAASGMQLGAASDMVTDYLSAFGMEADKAGYFADLLAAAQASSNTTAEALGEAYQNCAANLNAAGQDIETVTSMLEGLANQGYKGSRAGTALAAIMRDITNGMEKGAISIGNTSVSVMDAKGNFRDLTDILKDVDKATNGMGAAEKAAALAETFTADSTKGLNLVLNEGIDKIAGYEDSLRAAGGSAEEMAAIMNDNLTGDMAQMNSALEELGLKIYEKFEQPLRNAVKFVTNSVIPAIEWAMNHLPEIGIVLSAVSAVIVKMKWASIAKKLTMVKGALKGLMGALGGISAPVLAIIAVVAVLALAFTNLWKNNEEFRNKITAIWEGIKGKFEAFGQKITDKLNELGFDFENFTEVLKAIWDGFCALLAPVFEGVFQQISNIVGLVLDVLVGLFDVVVGIFTGDWERVWEGVKEIFGGVWDFITNTFSNCMNTFKGLADTVLGWFGSSWDKVWTSVKNFFVGIWDGIVSFFSGIWETIKNVVTVGIMFIKEIISAAFQLITLPFRLIWENCKETVLSVWEKIKNTISNALNTVKSKISEKLEPVIEIITAVTNKIKNVIANVWNAICSTTSAVWGRIKDAISSKINAVWSVISSITSGIRNTVSNAFSSVYNTVQSIFGRIYDSISSKITSAKNAVSNAVNAIKGFFNFSWNLPKIKLPHFSITGDFSLSPPSVPHFSIDWYKDGGILTKPTIFGAAGNTLLAGGEAGAEAVVPLATLWEKLETMIQAVFNSASSTGGSPGTSLISKAGELMTLDDFSLGGLAGNGGVMIYYDFSNFTWSPHIQTGDGNNDADDFMAKLRAHEAEFFDWLDEFIKMREVAQYS